MKLKIKGMLLYMGKRFYIRQIEYSVNGSFIYYTDVTECLYIGEGI